MTGLGGFLRDCAAVLLVLLLLCVDGWGCGATPDASEPDEGWCCAGMCGLSGEDANTFDSCSCAGVVSHNPERRGECRNNEGT